MLLLDKQPYLNSGNERGKLIKEISNHCLDCTVSPLLYWHPVHLLQSSQQSFSHNADWLLCLNMENQLYQGFNQEQLDCRHMIHWRKWIEWRYCTALPTSLLPLMSGLKAVSSLGLWLFHPGFMVTYLCNLITTVPKGSIGGLDQWPCKPVKLCFIHPAATAPMRDGLLAHRECPCVPEAD